MVLVAIKYVYQTKEMVIVDKGIGVRANPNNKLKLNRV